MSRAAILARPELPSLVFLILLVAALSVTTPSFFTIPNLQAVLEQVVVVSIVALAVNQVILSEQIDISTGSLVAVCAFVYGNIALTVGGSWVPLLGALATGAFVGLVNGVLSTYGRVSSIITTMGMLFALRGAVLLAAGAQVLNLPPESRIFGLGEAFGVPISIIVLVVVFALMGVVSRHTVFGRNVYAVGGNDRAARTVGLPLNQVRLMTLVLSGLSCGLAAAVLLGQIGQLQATAATGFELKVIAAVVLGGTSITGGRGSNLAPVVGAVLVGVILNALTLNRVPGIFELFVLGVLILAAVSFDGLRTRLTDRRR
ncbi:MAG: ABC transporter permease [Immundisolibacterales bacterium]|nr:ABC transporter permease [Immundisolibacterales bacterium]